MIPLLLLGCAAGPGFDLLLISIDGVRPELILEELGTLDTLGAVAEQGGFLELELLGVSDTKAAHAQMLTGYGSDVTGVVSGEQFQVIEPGLSVHERLRARYGAGIHTAFIAGKPGMIGIQAGQPFVNAADSADVRFNEHVSTDQGVMEMHEAVKKARSRDFFGFFHFADTDNAAHEFGERSAEQRDALHDIDDAIGGLMYRFAVQDREPVVVVTTDHGFAPGSHRHQEDSHQVWVLSSEPLSSGGSLAQVPWTVLDLYGIDAEVEQGSMLD